MRQMRELVVPTAELTRGFTEHEFAERADQAAFFGDGNELDGVNEPALGVLPTDEGLESSDCRGGYVDNRLVVHPQLAGRQGAAKFCLGVDAVAGLGPKSLREHGRSSSAVFFGLIHRCIRIA